MTLLERIEEHLKDNGICATTFGRDAVGDPRFVLDLRNGRNPRRKTVMRLEAYLAKRGAADCACRGRRETVMPGHAGSQRGYPANPAKDYGSETRVVQRGDRSGFGEGENR